MKADLHARIGWGAMPGFVPLPTWVFHLTDITNLPGIIADGEIRSRSRAPANVTDIAYPHLVGRAERTTVPCGPGGAVTDYARFFFAPRPPMLWSIATGRVAGRTQQTVVQLVLEAQELAGERPVVVADGHVIEALTDFHPFDGLDKVDWNVMWVGQPTALSFQSVPVRYWHGIPSDPDRPRRRQAEFLVHEYAPVTRVAAIAVIDNNMRTRVQALLPQHVGGWKPPVVACPHWFYL